jgi:hypothetical protein
LEINKLVPEPAPIKPGLVSITPERTVIIMPIKVLYLKKKSLSYGVAAVNVAKKTTTLFYKFTTKKNATGVAQTMSRTSNYYARIATPLTI